jgi:hypothetical protein
MKDLFAALAITTAIAAGAALTIKHLWPEEQPTPRATRLAEGSAASEWINPKTVSDSIQLVMARSL